MFIFSQEITIRLDVIEYIESIIDTMPQQEGQFKIYAQTFRSADGVSSFSYLTLFFRYYVYFLTTKNRKIINIYKTE
jgi:hypothetical protein